MATADPSGQPLAGMLVLDLSRMLPGAVLARSLVDLGARVIKVEDPESGDPLRHVPPLVGGVGAAFCAFFRGTESVTLDLRVPRDAAKLLKLAKHADVLVESFRPGTRERWGLSNQRLSELNPTLITCSLPSFGAPGPFANRVAHDLNIVALSGLLEALAPRESKGVPNLQIADVTTGLLALSSLLAAILLRRQTGHGRHLVQPLATSVLPFLTAHWAESAAKTADGDRSGLATLLSGEVPSYGLYSCSDGRRISVAALEPKFWATLLGIVGLPELAGDGMVLNRRAREALAARFAERPSTHWLGLAGEANLPVTVVQSIRDAMAGEPYARHQELTRIPGGDSFPTPAPYLAEGVAPPRTERSAAPSLGRDTASVLREFSVGD